MTQHVAMQKSEKSILLLSAHQPVYLPWLGLFHKMAVADQFVIFDAVPYSKKNWYNRNRIKGVNGEIMLSVPVFSKGSAQILQKDIRIQNELNWSTKHWKSLETSYGKTPYFQDYAQDIKNIYDHEWDLLADLNEALLRLLMGYLGIETPLVRASSFEFQGQKSDLVLDMCKQLDARSYLFGGLGRGYADEDAFNDAGVIPFFQEYVHPTYEQGRGEFLPYMSVLDLLFYTGKDSREILLSGNPVREDYLAMIADNLSYLVGQGSNPPIRPRR